MAIQLSRIVVKSMNVGSLGALLISDLFLTEDSYSGSRLN